MVFWCFLVKQHLQWQKFILSFSGAACSLSRPLPGGVELRVRLRHPQLEQHLAELDRGGAGVSDDARARPQRQRRHRDQVFRRRAGSVDLHCPTLLRLKHFSKKHSPEKNIFCILKRLCFAISIKFYRHRCYFFESQTFVSFVFFFSVGELNLRKNSC